MNEWWKCGKKKNVTTGTRKHDIQSKQQPIYNTQHSKISIGSSVINQGQPFRGFNNDMVIDLGSPSNAVYIASRKKSI